MMADELEAMEGPVSEDAELLGVKPRDRPSEEELKKAWRRLNFHSMTALPDAFKFGVKMGLVNRKLTDQVQSATLESC
jgi:hypothetical protein